MSAILDALKKLEAETAESEVESRTASPSADPGRARSGFLIAGSVVLFLVVAAIVWKLATLSINPTVADTRAAQNRVRVALSGHGVDRDEQAKQAPAALPAQAEPIETHTDKAEPEAGEDESGSNAESKSSAQQGRSGAAEPEQGENSSKTIDSQTPSVSDKADAGQNPDTEGSAVAKHAAEPELMEDGPLTLQAISWADAPENRIAVINGKICRQTERIDGYRIQTINPDDVRVTDGEKTWRLSFGIR